MIERKYLLKNSLELTNAIKELRNKGYYVVRERTNDINISNVVVHCNNQEQVEELENLLKFRIL